MKQNLINSENPKLIFAFYGVKIVLDFHCFTKSYFCKILAYILWEMAENE